MRTNLPALTEGSVQRFSATVYEAVQSRILWGEYPPGAWISVEDLCRAFGVSRQPVMDAMRRLSSDWLVEIVPQVGCRVARYNAQAIEDYINAFGEMESRIATMAAQRRTEKQLDRLTEITQQIRTRAVMDQENLSLGRHYHRTVLEMAHSTVLARLCEQLWAFGTFVSNPQIVANMGGPEIARRRNTLGKLTNAIRVRNGALARTYMAQWLTSVAGLRNSKKRAATLK